MKAGTHKPASCNGPMDVVSRQEEHRTQEERDMMILFIAIIGTILAISLWALYDFDFDAMMYEEDEKCITKE